MVVAPGGAIDVDIRFQPSSFGFKSATITIDSDDPAGPRTVSVNGVAPAPQLALMIADDRSFGDCCVGAFRDQPLTLSSRGLCTLTVTGITSSSAEFLLPDVVSYPLTIEAGNSLEVPMPLPADELRPEDGHGHREQRRSGRSAHDRALGERSRGQARRDRVDVLRRSALR